MPNDEVADLNNDPEAIRAEINKFLDAVYDGVSGFLDIGTLGDETHMLDQERWFKWPEERSTVQKYIFLREELDVYSAVALYSEKVRSKEDDDAMTQVVVADADATHPSKFRISPSISSQTSPGRWHCFWILDKPVTEREASEASRKIGKAHNLEASSGIRTKFLRVPGTTNTKHGTDRVEAKYTGEIYSLSEINKVYSDISLAGPIKVKDEATPSMLDLEPLEETLTTHTDLAALYLQAVPPGGSWSERLYRLEIDLFRLGYTSQEVFTLAWNAQCNKYHPNAEGMLTESGTPISRRNNGQDVLWVEVLKAQGEYRIETQQVLADPEPDIKDLLNFLSDEERDWTYENPTFVDEFEQWVASRSPQSSPRYRRSAGYMLLSCVYGDKCFFVPQYGKITPNIWLLTLGRTTADRKTTVYNLMIDVLEEWERVNETTVFVGNTFSAEALNTTLGPRDGLVSLASKDEVHGFFRETLGKGYMAGIKEYLTELFNGKVLIALRQNKESAQKVRAKTVFNWYGIGTDDGAAKVLNLEDFASGFMVRFLYAIPDPKPIDIEDELIRMRDYEGRTQYTVDPAPSDFVRGFTKNLRSFKDTTEIIFPEDVMNRFYKWQRHILKAVDDMIDKKYIKPGIDRMSNTLLKCITLLAFSQGRSEATVGDVLHVLRQAEWWVEDLMKMVHSVAESEFQSEVNELWKYIASKGTRKNKANAMQVFGKYRPRQFDEMVESLHQQGRIEITVENKITYIRANTKNGE